MSTDYKPGTVAVATVRGVPNVRLIRGIDGFWLSGHIVRHEQWHGGDVVTDVRPLVVLDPTEYPNRDVARELHDYGLFAFADAWNAQTRPPKPAEPTGLGAVVEDAEGVRWVRIERSGVAHWHDASTPPGFPLRYDHVDAVRVLSEGVTA